MMVVIKLQNIAYVNVKEFHFCKNTQFGDFLGFPCALCIGISARHIVLYNRSMVQAFMICFKSSGEDAQ